MKINNLNLNRIKQMKSEVQPAQATARPSKVSQDQVSISEEARFLSEVRESAGTMEDVRADKVEQARADIANGTLGTEEDYRRAVEALMMEL